MSASAAFAETNPTLTAELELDGNGHPKVIDQDGRRHYLIKVHTKEAGGDVHAVTYLLDPSYLDPVLEVRDQSREFPLEIASYGDYELKAKVRSSAGTSLASVRLSKALQETHGDSRDPSIQQALRDIAAN